MEIGKYVLTPRFLRVKIDSILTKEEAIDQKFNEPTHYKSEDFDIKGKNIGKNQMIFAAVHKK